MICVPEFLWGNPSDHLLDWCWQCQRWGRGCALNQSQQLLWTESLGVTVSEIPAHFVFTNLKLIGMISLMELSAVRWGWGKDLFFKTLTFWMWFGVFVWVWFLSSLHFNKIPAWDLSRKFGVTFPWLCSNFLVLYINSELRQVVSVLQEWDVNSSLTL